MPVLPVPWQKSSHVGPAYAEGYKVYTVDDIAWMRPDKIVKTYWRLIESGFFGVALVPA